MNYDVLIVGGGVVGSSIARELARYRVKVGVLDQAGDVCCGNSGRNTGLLHAGFLYAKGSYKGKFCIEGNRRYDQIAGELDLPLKRTGKLTVGSTQGERERLLKLIENGTGNGVPGMRMVEREELKTMEPHVAGDFAMLTPTSAIINPYKYTIAVAENAALNGVGYHLGQKLIKSEKLPGGGWRLSTEKDVFEAKWVVNSGGFNADIVARILGEEGYQISNGKGEYLILDTKAGQYLSMPVYPAPDENWMYDVHVTPTIDGNVLVGPTILNGDVVRGQFDTTQRAMKLLADNGAKLFMPMRPGLVIRSFAGQFPHIGAPATAADDFILDVRGDERVIHLIGIDSPGLTSACALGEWVASQIARRERLVVNEAFNPVRKGSAAFHGKDRETQRRMIRENPDYGEIVCRCETITRAEILQAIHNPLGVTSVTGIKYRTRATMGRCQGGYCQTRITAMIRQELGVEPEDVRYAGEDSYMFTGEVRKR